MPIEIALNGRLDNILTHLGVVGEQGHPGFAAIEGTVYVGSDADEAAVQRAWQRTLDRSPAVPNTVPLRRRHHCLADSSMTRTSSALCASASFATSASSS